MSQSAVKEISDECITESQASSESLITEHMGLWTCAITRKNITGRGNNQKYELYGIKKLRELILELAARGKLVAQDPNDEPSSELLKRMAIEKALLVKEGKIRKSKKATGIAINEKPFDIPDSWHWARLPDVASYSPGKTPPTKRSVFWGGDYNWVSIADMEHRGTVKVTTKMVSQKAAEEVFRGQPVPAGTLLMSFKLTVGKVSILEIDAYHNEAIISVIPFTGVSRDFLANVLPERALAGNHKKAIKGNTLNSDSLALLLIPVPPEQEQRRIVAKVDELMTLCDQLENQTEQSLDAHATLSDSLLDALTRAQSAEELAENWQRLEANWNLLFPTTLAGERALDKLKQTILQLAVMGKLVPQNPNDEPASELLKRIAAEKQKLIKGKTIKKQKPVPPLSDVEKPFELPKGWEWCRFSDALFNRDSERVPISVDERNGRQGKYPYYGASGIIDYIDEYIFDETLLLIGEDGANLINRSTPIAFLASGKYWVNNHAHVLAAIDLDLLRYVCLHINAISLEPYITGTAQPKMNQVKMNSILLALPPHSEQRKIVAKVDEIMTLCNQLKTNLQAAQTTQQQFTHAVVSSVLN